MSIREWCDRHGVSEPSYYFKRRELARRKEQHQDSSLQIVPVNVTPPVAGSRWDVEIELPDRILVRVGFENNLNLLHQALALLRTGGPGPSHGEPPLASEDLLVPGADRHAEEL